MKEESFDVRTLRDLYRPDRDRIDLAKQRQAAFFRHEKPDALPAVVLGASLTEAQSCVPSADFSEAYQDRGRMLMDQMRGAMSRANSNCDGVPSIRGNFGVGALCSCLGLEQEIYADKMPWLLTHLDRKQIARLTVADIRIQGTFARGLDFMRFYREIIGDLVPIFVMDHQGPFDLAHLIMGDDIFLAIYDEPGLVHHLLDLCVEMSRRCIALMKEINGELFGRHYHSNFLYAENMGLRICEDTTAIVGPDIMHEFAIPYTRRLAEYFGGAWVHYCGRNDELTKAICACPEIRAINFGHIPGHEQDHPFEDDMQICLESGIVYTGGWPRKPGESALDYFGRLHEWAKAGVLFPFLSPCADDPRFDTVEKVRDHWYSL